MNREALRKEFEKETGMQYDSNYSFVLSQYQDWLESKLLQQDQDKDHQCKHIKRQGESCTLNNECKYPNCPSEQIHLSEKDMKIFTDALISDDTVSDTIIDTVEASKILGGEFELVADFNKEIQNERIVISINFKKPIEGLTTLGVGALIKRV